MDYSMPSFPDFSISWSFSSVQLLSSVRLFATLWSAARQTSLSITNSRSLLKLIAIGLAMLSDRLILCRPLLLLPSIFLNIRGFSNESVIRIKWPKYWSFSFSPSSEYSELILQSKDSQESSPTPQFKSKFLTLLEWFWFFGKID